VTAGLSDEEVNDWTQEEADGAWEPDPPDAPSDWKFSKSGFRAFSLSASDGSWRIELSQLDVNGREPAGLVDVYAPFMGAAFEDLDGQVVSRVVSISRGRAIDEIAKALETRLGASQTDWGRRLDYLCLRSMRELHASSAGETSFTGRPPRPGTIAEVFVGRIRVGRTCSLFGPGSAGKTTLAAGLMVSASSGRVVIPGWVPTRAFNVGVLDYDEGEAEEEVRLHAICEGHGVSLGNYQYKRAVRPLAECANEVGRWIVDNGIELLLASPVNRALRATSGDPGGPVFELYEALREFGTTNILIDHVVGAALDRKDVAREYGSVAKRDAARGSYSVYMQSEQPGSRVVVLRNTKPDALAPRRAPQAIRVEFDPPIPKNGIYERITFHEDAVEDAMTDGDQRTETQPERFFRFLMSNDLGLSTKAASALLGVPAGRIRDIARLARNAGHPTRFDKERGVWVTTTSTEAGA